jgi:hypothetical protein
MQFFEGKNGQRFNMVDRIWKAKKIGDRYLAGFILYFM